MQILIKKEYEHNDSLTKNGWQTLAKPVQILDLWEIWKHKGFHSGLGNPVISIKPSRAAVEEHFLL